MENNKNTVVTPENGKSKKITAAEIVKKERRNNLIKHIIVYTFLTLVAIYIIVPFYWMLITSLKSQTELELLNPTFFPKEIMWSNYKLALTQTDFNFARLMSNTIIVGVISTIGTLITTITAAFAFSRLSFKGRDLIFSIFLATMMIPGEMMVITNFITVVKFGWLKTTVGIFTAMIVPFLTSVFYIFLLRQNFKQIPNELYYAAKVDGTTDLKYLFRIMIPIALPTIITITILKLMGSWNAYVWPNLVSQDETTHLITNGLRGGAFTDAETGRVSQGLQMAATTAVTVPLLLVFIFLRKYIMRGVSRSGIKG